MLTQSRLNVLGVEGEGGGQGRPRGEYEARIDGDSQDPSMPGPLPIAKGKTGSTLVPPRTCSIYIVGGGTCHAGHYIARGKYNDVYVKDQGQKIDLAGHLFSPLRRFLGSPKKNALTSVTKIAPRSFDCPFLL
jgi:hypothetical protein